MVYINHNMVEYKTIKDWPEDERPREKLLKRGPESLSDGELLAIILRTGDGTSKQSALDHARALLSEFKGLRNLASAGINEIRNKKERKGIGPAKAATIMAAFEIGRRLSKEEIRPGDTFRCSEDVFRHYHSNMRDSKKRAFSPYSSIPKTRSLKRLIYLPAP